jgi:hypothetical protein
VAGAAGRRRVEEKKRGKEVNDGLSRLLLASDRKWRVRVVS